MNAPHRKWLRFIIFNNLLISTAILHFIAANLLTFSKFCPQKKYPPTPLNRVTSQNQKSRRKITMKHLSRGALLLSMTVPAPAFAAGFALEQQNAAAIGSAYAGAQAESADPGFIFYNPAALAGVEGADLSVGTAALLADSDYTDASGALLGAAPVSGNTAGSGALNNAYLPAFAIGLQLSEAIAVGFSVNAPFGLNSEYGEDSAIRYHALDTNFKTITMAPTAAIMLSPELSVGASLRIQYLDFEASNAVDAAGVLAAGGAMITPGSDDILSRLDADDFAVGYQLGAQARLGGVTTFGLNFTSKIEHNFSGEAVFEIANSVAGQTLNASFGLFENTEFSSAINTPASLSVGVSHRANDRLTVKASASYTLWHSFEAIAISFENASQPPELLTQDWGDVLSVSFGGDFALDNRTTLRAGVLYDPSPVNGAVASPRIQDNDRFWVNAGVSRRVSDTTTVDIGGGYVFVDERQISQPASAPENLFRGSLDSAHDTSAFVLSIRLRHRTGGF